MENENPVQFTKPAVILAINNLADSVFSLNAISVSDYRGEGSPVIDDLDKLASMLIEQIVCCVPREKQHAILTAHGLEEYIEDLDEYWNKYVEFASADR